MSNTLKLKLKKYIYKYMYITDIQKQVLETFVDEFIKQNPKMSRNINVYESDENMVVFYWKPNIDEVAFVYLEVDCDGNVMLSYNANEFDKGWSFFHELGTFNYEDIVKTFLSI